MFQAIVLYIVVDLIVGDAIETAPVGAISPVIGPGWTILLRIVLPIPGIVELAAFLASLVEDVRGG